MVAKKTSGLKELDQDEQKHTHLLRAMLGTIYHYFDSIEDLLGGADDPRNPLLIEYPLETLFFTGILMFLCQLGARRQINYPQDYQFANRAKTVPQQPR